MTQLFAECSMQRGDKRVRGREITCCRCPTKAAVPMAAMNNGFSTQKVLNGREQQIIQRKFEGQGWFVGGSASQHRCPTCRSIERTAKHLKHLKPVTPKEKPVMQNSTLTALAAVRAPPPPEMSRADRRLIFERLNDVYADEKVGYSGEWTDKRVAEDMGVPLAWVRTVREENFGPEGNADLAGKLAAAMAIIKDGRDLLDQANKLKSQIDSQYELINRLMTATAPLLDHVVRAERIVQGIERAVKP